MRKVPGTWTLRLRTIWGESSCPLPAEWYTKKDMEMGEEMEIFEVKTYELVVIAKKYSFLKMLNLSKKPSLKIIPKFKFSNLL